MNIIKATSLEGTSDIKSTLDWKINQLTEDKRSISNGLADYFGIAVDNLTGQLDQLKKLESEIKERKKAISEQISLIKTDGADFLKENGIETLEGILISSVTINKGRGVTTKQKFSLLVPKKESETFLIESGLAIMESVEVPYSKDTLRINKRKIALLEIEDA